MSHDSTETTTARDDWHRATAEAGNGQLLLDDANTLIRAADERGAPWGERARLYDDERRLLCQQAGRVAVVASLALQQAILEADGTADRAGWAEELLESVASLQGLVGAAAECLAAIRGLAAAGELRQAADLFEPLLIVTGKLDHEVRVVYEEGWSSLPRV